MLVAGTFIYQIGTGSDHPQRKAPKRESLRIPASHRIVQHQEVNMCMTEDKIDTFVADNLDAYSNLKV